MSESSLTPNQRGTTIPEPMLSVSGLRKVYPGNKPGVVTTAIDNLTFDVAKGSFVAVVGPSGCGKTTLLRCLSGLLPATEGTIRFNGRIVNNVQAGLGVVFQDYTRSLMPWLSVEKNVMFGLGKLPAQERKARTAGALEHVGLADVSDRYPWQLSGGMQQRVAIARAISSEPDMLVMDEPFASVDAQTRTSLESMVMDLWAEDGWTGLLVTHDIDEAIFMADEVLVLSHRPSRIVERIKIDLERPRDQLATRALESFSEYRAYITNLIGTH